MEHYRSQQPERGCGLLIVGALLLAIAISGTLLLVIFGFEWWQAIVIVVVGALAVYWLLTTFSRRRMD